MAERLKIYACSGIGEAEAQSTYTYWTDNTNTVENTQAVNTLLVYINSCYTEYRFLRNLSQSERLERLNDIDLYTVCLEAAKRFKDDSEKLEEAGKAIAEMLSKGDFDFYDFDETKRDAHLDELIKKANDAWDSDLPVEHGSAKFFAWWKETIVARNKVGLSKEAIKETNEVIAKNADNIAKAAKKIAKIKGIGDVDEAWKNNNEISTYLTEAGTYFAYLFMTDEQLSRLPAKTRKILTSKRDYQRRIYNYCKAYFVGIYGTEEEMQMVIRNGIIAETKSTPEELCEQIANGKVKSVGQVLTFAAFIAEVGVKGFLAILAVAAGMIVSIVKVICDTVYKSNVQKYASMSQAVIDGGTPDEEDLEELDFSGSALGKKTGKSNWWLIGLAGAAALLLLKK